MLELFNMFGVCQDLYNNRVTAVHVCNLAISAGQGESAFRFSTPEDVIIYYVDGVDGDWFEVDRKVVNGRVDDVINSTCNIQPGYGVVECFNDGYGVRFIAP